MGDDDLRVYDKDPYETPASAFGDDAVFALILTASKLQVAKYRLVESR